MSAVRVRPGVSLNATPTAVAGANFCFATMSRNDAGAFAYDCWSKSVAELEVLKVPVPGAKASTVVSHLNALKTFSASTPTFHGPPDHAIDRSAAAPFPRLPL